MKQFTIFINGKRTEIARVSEAIGKSGVNIKAIVGDIKNTTPYVKLVTSDIQTTQRALKTYGYNYELNDILSVEMQDKPGELYKVAKKLEKARINIESIYILGQRKGKTEVALVVDDMVGAKNVLKKMSG
jgi:hypothetical protein